jgi:hypothetical protein
MEYRRVMYICSRLNICIFSLHNWYYWCSQDIIYLSSLSKSCCLKTIVIDKLTLEKTKGQSRWEDSDIVEHKTENADKQNKIVLKTKMMSNIDQ